MKISIDIENDDVAKKILWLLNNPPSEGGSITKKANNDKAEETAIYTDKYVKENWQKIAYAASGDSTRSDDDVLEEEYGKYLYGKHNI